MASRRRCRVLPVGASWCLFQEEIGKGVSLVWRCRQRYRLGAIRAGSGREWKQTGTVPAKGGRPLTSRNRGSASQLPHLLCKCFPGKCKVKSSPDWCILGIYNREYFPPCELLLCSLAMLTKMARCVLSVTRDAVIPPWVVGPQQLNGRLVGEDR